MATGNFTTFPVPFRSGDEFIAETKDVRDEVLILKSDTDGLKTQAVTARDEAEGFRDSAETIAAAVGDVAGLPSLTGNANRALQVNSAGDAVLWGTDLTFAAVEQFDTSGTWTKDPDARWVMVEAWGAGGGGATNDTAGGGSGGGYIRQFFRAVDVPDTVSVTIGAGGAGAPAGANAKGSSGGDTTFGALATALGGVAGNNNGDGGGAPEHAADGGFQGDISDPSLLHVVNYGAGFGGLDGEPYGGSAIYGGGGGAGGGTNFGGKSIFGGAGGDSTADTVGGDGSAPGGGGAGGNGATFPGGGDGGDGRVIVRQW